MKIVYISDEYPGLTSNFGGIAVVFKNEVDSLISLGYDVELILVNGDLITDSPDYVYSFKFPKTGRFRGIRGRLSLAKFVNKRYSKKDIVVVSDYNGLLITKVKPQKIVQLHGSLSVNVLKSKKKLNFLIFFIEFLNILLAQKIRSVSNYVYNESCKLFPLLKFKTAQTIHNGIRPFDDKQLYSTNDEILFLGKLSHLKGVHFLSDIINRVHRVLPEQIFTIIGHDDIKRDVSQKDILIKDINFPEFVRFIDRIENKDIFKYLGNSKLLILPSMSEALPMVLIEAFAAKRPAVAFNVGGPAEIIDDGINGFLVNPFNTKLFSERVIQIIKEKNNYEIMSNNALNKFNKSFQLINIIKEIEAFYNLKPTNGN